MSEKHQNKGYYQCTLSDKQLLKKCANWITELSKDSDSWQVNQPPDFNNDPDLLFQEFMNRFSKIKNKFATGGPQRDLPK